MAGNSDREKPGHQAVTIEDVERILHLGELLRSVLTPVELAQFQPSATERSNGKVNGSKPQAFFEE